MLFHIEQVHRPEQCPYGHGGSPSLHNAEAGGVRVIGTYGAFMEHTVYFIVDAADIDSVNEFLKPGMKVCTSRITPVSDHPVPV